MQLDPTSLIGVASQVHSLLRKYDALGYFRDRVHEAAREYITAVAECERREKLRRDTVAKDGVLSLPLDDEVVKEKTKDRYFFWSEEFRGRIKLPPDVTEPLMPLTHGAQFPNRPAVPRCLSNGITRDDWSVDDEREVEVFNKELRDWDKKRSDYVTATKEGGPSKWEEDKHRIFELAKKRSFPDDGDDGLPYVFRVEALLPDKLSEDRYPPTAPLPVPESEKELSPNFKYAGLAAIYDAHWGGSERIAPWGVVKFGGKVSPASGLPSEWKTPEELGSYRAASWYWRLANSAKDLDERNTTIVNSWVADIEADLARAPRGPTVGDEAADDDDSLPAKQRKLAPSRVKAKAAYEWAMSSIPGAEDMTIAELYDAVECHPSTASDMLPPNPEAFGRYLRDAGVKRYNKLGKSASKSVRHEDEL